MNKLSEASEERDNDAFVLGATTAVLLRFVLRIRTPLSGSEEIRIQEKLCQGESDKKGEDFRLSSSDALFA